MLDAPTAPMEPDAAPALEPLEVRTARPEDAPAWEAFLASRPESRPFQRPAWLRAVGEVFGHADRSLVAWRGDRIAGVLPMMKCRGLGRLAHLVSTPYGTLSGPCAADDEARLALVERAQRHAEREGVGRLELRCEDAIDAPGLVASDLYVNFDRPIPGDWDGILKAMKKDERRLVRRASDTHGLELCEGSWYVPDLARLFHESKRGLGSPGLPVAWFEALQDALGDACAVHMVRRGSEPLAVSMGFVHGGTYHMYYIGTAPGANREYAATSFMIARLQEWCLERGVGHYDLGRSRADAGTASFKRNQGFAPRPLAYRYHCVKSDGAPTFNPSNPRTELLRRTWSRMPSWLARRLSTPLSKRLP